jgi:hypothetical protein
LNGPEPAVTPSDGRTAGPRMKGCSSGVGLLGNVLCLMRINEMTNSFIHVNADWEVETLSDTAMWIERTEFRRSDSNDRSACHFTHGPLCDLCASERRNPGSDRHRGQSPHSGTELNLRPPFHHRTADRRQRRGNDTGDTGTTQSSFSPSRPDTTATSSLPQHCYLHHTRRHRLSVSFSPVSHSLHLLSLCPPSHPTAHIMLCIFCATTLIVFLGETSVTPCILR